MHCLFCDFVSGKRKKGVRGYPFIPVHTTKNTLSFLSIDCPAREDMHVLIIPKKHHDSITDMSAKVLKEMMNHVARITRILRKSHEGCNILINEGHAAGQYIPHVHVHIIPRDKNDGIAVEKWHRRTITIEEFSKVSNRLKRLLS